MEGNRGRNQGGNDSPKGSKVLIYIYMYIYICIYIYIYIYIVECRVSVLGTTIMILGSIHIST